MGKLVFVDKEEAVRRMDRWGGEGTPFFFMIDFDMEQCLVERPEDIPEDELLYSFPRAGNWAGKMPRLKNLSYGKVFRKVLRTTAILLTLSGGISGKGIRFSLT